MLKKHNLDTHSYLEMNLRYLNKEKNPAMVRLLRLQLPGSGSPSQDSSTKVLAPDDMVKSKEA